MGERVEFGYFAAPASGSGPAVVVVQEWWGIVPHIQDVVERFAREGFVAIAPDLYHGKTTKSPDEAGKLFMEVDADRAAKEINDAGNYLLSRPECSSKTYGIVGFCMGGALAQYAATKDRNVGATASFYGGFKKLHFEWENLAGPLLLIYAGNDKNVTAEQGRALEKQLKSMGKEVEVVVYPNTEHAFFNDTRPEVYDAGASADAWKRTLELFRTNLR
jgi:carboxymethylenebutenolidase